MGGGQHSGGTQKCPDPHSCWCWRQGVNASGLLIPAPPAPRQPLPWVSLLLPSDTNCPYLEAKSKNSEKSKEDLSEEGVLLVLSQGQTVLGWGALE